MADPWSGRNNFGCGEFPAMSKIERQFFAFGILLIILAIAIFLAP